MKLQYKSSGVIVVVPNGTAYDAAMFREVKEQTFSETLKECKEKAEQKTERKKRSKK